MEILELFKRQKKQLAVLIDPDKQDAEKAGYLASSAEKAGSSVIMVGGSTITSQKQVDETVAAIKKATLNSIIDIMNQAGIEPVAIIPDTLCLTADNDGQWAILLHGEQAIGGHAHRTVLEGDARRGIGESAHLAAGVQQHVDRGGPPGIPRP